MAGQIHDVFTQTIKDRATQAASHAAAVHSGDDLRDWNGPEVVEDPLDSAGITAGFDREEVNTNFQSLLAGESPGTVGDAIAVKVQCDYVAVCERAYRARHCTPVRLIAMMAARRLGHGDDRGVFLGGVAKYVQDSLKAGQ